MAESLVTRPDAASGIDIIHREQASKLAEAIVLDDRALTIWQGGCGSFRTPGSGAAGQKLASLWNAVGSGVVVIVDYAGMIMDYTTNSGTVRAVSWSIITTAPTGGTILTPVPFDTTSGAQSADVTARGGSSADGTASALTATPGDHLRRGFHWHANTAVQQYLTELDKRAGKRIHLREGEGLLCTISDTSSASASHIVNFDWREVTLP